MSAPVTGCEGSTHSVPRTAGTSTWTPRVKIPDRANSAIENAPGSADANPPYQVPSRPMWLRPSMCVLSRPWQVSCRRSEPMAMGPSVK